ncbi:hypothetical protein [Streptomyces sp. TRM68367]|uniref:hypothetical protein n=1 Tax=Streptomyces sp. TRM68367 TaxID=2758415 RepID=UPI00165A2F46|nr:hypothetical protein [Streptomyces sp. TRM68367]MBC9727197.1 hypothetical protein [Streptomyces sp. TRM68367]
MSAATIHPAPAGPSGASVLQGSHRHPLGEALHAVRVFAGAAFDVIILGEYGAEAGVVRRK